VRKNDQLIVKSYKEWDLFNTSDWDTTVAVTFNLKQALMERKSTYGSLLRLDERQCRSTLKHFMNLLNRSVYESKNRHGRKRLRVITVVEKGTGRWHVHAAIECPGYLSVQTFTTLIRDCWSKCDWSHGLDIQPAPTT
jgi:hypothetical protein